MRVYFLAKCQNNPTRAGRCVYSAGISPKRANIPIYVCSLDFRSLENVSENGRDPKNDTKQNITKNLLEENFLKQKISQKQTLDFKPLEERDDKIKKNFRRTRQNFV